MTLAFIVRMETVPGGKRFTSRALELAIAHAINHALESDIAGAEILNTDVIEGGVTVVRTTP